MYNFSVIFFSCEICDGRDWSLDLHAERGSAILYHSSTEAKNQNRIAFPPTNTWVHSLVRVLKLRANSHIGGLS